MRRFLVSASLLLVLYAVPQYAQEFRATVTGRVTDATNASVPRATVQVKNVDTNETTGAITDAQGDYSALLLRPGRYSISTQVTGFKNYLREGVVLNVGQTATINITLELGALSEQVTVTSESPLLEAANADRGAVIDNQRVTELALNGRNPFMLSMLVAGVNYNGNPVYQRPFDNGAIAEWTISGSQTRNTEFLLDGAPNNAEAGGNNIAYVPPVDSVQEFKIQTNSYDAQYGHTGGGIVNVSLKSGTNRLHGTVYEFMRRNALDANSFQNNAYGAPKQGHFLDQYGVQLDGPVSIPKLYNGRDKTFFLFNYEGYRKGTPYPLILSVPALEMRDGDFSKLVNGNGDRITIYDPTSGRLVGGLWTRTPFAGNIIPSNRINPIARKVLAFMPKPNTSAPGLDYSQNNFFMPGGNNIDSDGFYNLVAKIDQNIGDKHRIYFRHANNRRHERVTENGIQEAPGHRGYYPHTRINYTEVLDWVSTLSPSFVANARLSFGYYRQDDAMHGNDGFDNTTLGFPASLVSQIPHGAFFGSYAFSGYIGLGRYPSMTGSNTYAFHPNVTKIHGRHTIKGGVDMRWIQYVTQSWGNPLAFSSSTDFTQRDYSRSDGISGNSIATWLLGTPSSGSSDNNVFPFFTYRYYAPWVQDDWKVTHRLTVNLGLRWDFNMPPIERYNRMNRSFDQTMTNSLDKLIDRTKFPTLPTMRGGMLFAGVNGVPRAAADLYNKALQPRFGFAYNLRSKVVMRGGWGRSYINPTNSYLQTNGFSLATPLVTTLDGGQTGIPNLLNNPYPDGLQLPFGAAKGDLTFIGRGFSFVNSSFRLPYVNQFSFGFQVELPGRSKVEISYVGSRTKNLQTTRNANTYDLAFRQKCNLMEGGNPLYCDERLPNPFQGLEPFRGTTNFSAPTLARSSLAIAYPEFGSLTEQMRNDGALWYNSMQLAYEMRARNALTLTATYTLSKMIEESGFNDVQNNVMQRGLYLWDHPQRLTVSAVYELPFGRNKRWLKTSNGILSRLVSGWENTWIFQYQSGRPWDLPSNVIYIKEAKVPDIDWSASRVVGVKPCVARWNDNGTITMQSFSTKAGCTDYNFLITPRFAPRFTSLRDSRLRLHTVPVADLSLNKTTRITEKTMLQFRVEVFNAFNTYMFYNGMFNNNPESANFGTVDKASVGFEQTNSPRYVQLGLKFVW